MSPTNLDIDDELIDDVMWRFGFESKRETADHALRASHGEPQTRAQMLELEGVAWGGDRDATRGRTGAAAAS